MKVYVASSFLNKPAVREAEQILRDNGYEVTSKWVEHTGGEGIPYKLMHEGYKDLHDLLAADCILILWPGRLGTASELGVAIGTHKGTYLVTDGRPIDMPFAYLAQVHHISSVWEFMERTGRLPFQGAYNE